MIRKHPLAGFDYYKAVVAAQDLSNTEKVVAVGLRNHWNPDTTKYPCRPSVATLARYAGIADRSVTRILRTLEEKGWITTTRRKGQTNVYDIAIPDAARPSDIGDTPDLGDTSTPDMAPTDPSPHPRHQGQDSGDTQVTPPLTGVSPRTETINKNHQPKREQTQQNTKHVPAKAQIKALETIPPLPVRTQADRSSASAFQGRTAEQIMTDPWPYVLPDGTEVASTQIQTIESADSLDKSRGQVTTLTAEQREEWITWLCSLPGLPPVENLEDAARYYVDQGQFGRLVFKPNWYFLGRHERRFRAFLVNARDRGSYESALRRVYAAMG